MPRSTTRRIALVVCLVGSLAAEQGRAACTSGAKRLRVPEDCATIGAAVGALGDGGTIDIASGTYKFGSSGLVLGGKNKAMTLDARVQGAVVLSGQGLYPVVRLINTATNGKPIAFEGIRFVDGYSALSFQAGGVTLKNAQVTFADCIFENHRNAHGSTGGGALGLYGGNRVLVVRSRFTANRAKNQGGAIYVLTTATNGPSSLWVYASSFERNSTAYAGFSSTAAGGAIYSRNAKVVVADSSFDDNRAGWVGGAIYAWGSMGTSAPFCSYDTAPKGDLLISRSSFERNMANDAAGESTVKQTQGGAIHVENCVRARLLSSLFEENGADWGGAVSIDHAKLSVEQTIFRYNYSTLGASVDGYAIGGALLALASDPGTVDYPNGEVTITRTLFQGRRLGAASAVNSQVGGCLKTIGDSSKAMPIPASARLRATISDSAFFDCAVDQYSSSKPFVGGGAIDLDRSELVLSNVLLARNSAVASSSTVTGSGSGIAARDDSRVAFGSNVVLAGGSTDGPYGDVYVGFRSSFTGSFSSATATQSTPVLGMLVAAPSRPVGGPFAGEAKLTWAYAGAAAKLDGSSVGTNPKNGHKGAIEGAHALAVDALASCSRCSATVGVPVWPSTQLMASPSSIAVNGTSTLSWTTPSGTFLAGFVDRGLGEKGASGSATVAPKGSTTYRRLAVTAQGGALAEERVVVGSSP